MEEQIVSDPVISEQAVPEQPKPEESIQEVDKIILELVSTQEKLAVAEAEKALAKSETASLRYKYVLLQIYMKYNMSSSDKLSENGLIIRGNL
jgi:hypothetical protein